MQSVYVFGGISTKTITFLLKWTTHRQYRHGNWYANTSQKKWAHFENMPIQIDRKFYHQKLKIFRQKIVIFFHISAQKHRLWVLVRTASPRRF